MSFTKTSENPKSKLLQFLQLADTARALVNRIATEGSKRLQTDAEGLTLRERVLIGLAVKAYISFECLIQDATALRSEAFHHLKTLAETHIYFQWVGAETDDKRARLLLAEECRCKIAFYDANPTIDLDKNAYENLNRTLQTLTQGLEQEWKRFKNPNLRTLAGKINADTVGWYNRVYKPACEPAHISDLSEYMPPSKGPISLTPPQDIPAFRAHIALDYGLQIICDLLRNLSDMYDFGLAEAIAGLKAKIHATRSLPVA
jgi:hypothetical protein